MHEEVNYVEMIKEILVSENDLSFLHQAPKEVVQKLHAELQAYIQRTEEAQKPVYRVMAAATKFIPNFFIAKLAQDFLTPYIIAQVTLYLDAKDSANIGKSFPPEYLGKVALYVEPRLTSQIADHMGIGHVQKVVDEMIRLRFYRKLAEVSDYMNERMLIDLVSKINSSNDIAQIAEHMQDEHRLRRVAQTLSPVKKAQIVQYFREHNIAADRIEIFS